MREIRWLRQLTPAVPIPMLVMGSRTLRYTQKLPCPCPMQLTATKCQNQNHPPSCSSAPLWAASLSVCDMPSIPFPIIGIYRDLTCRTPESTKCRTSKCVCRVTPSFELLEWDSKAASFADGRSRNTGSPRAERSPKERETSSADFVLLDLTVLAGKHTRVALLSIAKRGDLMGFR
jgi:hypothetical protein